LAAFGALTRAALDDVAVVPSEPEIRHRHGYAVLAVVASGDQEIGRLVTWAPIS
jgi:hypothetical protein